MNTLPLPETRPPPDSTPDIAHIPRSRPLFRTLPGDPAREYYLYIPERADRNASVVVLVHGISQNAIEHVLRFAAEAERHNTILVAPLFDKAHYGKYQQVIDRKQGIRADLALFDILGAVAADTGVATGRVHLFGFSGGGQFVHRFTLLHPDRVASCVCAAAGWYTYPDPARRYPHGIGTHPLADGAFDPAAIRAVPIHVLVGSRDTARDASLRATVKLDAAQGETRCERAERWFQAMRAWGANPAGSFGTIPKAGHRFGNAAARRGLPAMVFERFALT